MNTPRAWRRRGVPTLLSALVLVVSGGCGDPGPSSDASAPTLSPLGSVDVRVTETLRVPLSVTNPDTLPLTYSFAAASVPGISQSAEIGGTPFGGSFVWTPVAGQEGDHTVDITITSGLGSHTQPLTVAVGSAPTAAPSFVTPEVGATYDLGANPCLRVFVEVRDADSDEIELTVSGEPDGAIFAQIADKQAILDWCPSPDQIEASSRWTATFEARDESHRERLQHTMVLRSQAREGCSGDAPAVAITTPAEGARVASSVGYLVEASVTDDQGLRDVPILYYTQVPPDLTSPKLEEFNQVFFARTGDRWQARIPSLGLEPGAEATLYVVASATDNDDATGATCDHTTDTPVLTFIAEAGDATERLDLCDPCSASEECLSGVCGQSESGARCLMDCAEGLCASCVEVTSVEGTIAQACGTVATQCEGGETSCDDDGFEDNDTAETRVDVSFPLDAQVCPNDDDYYNVALAENQQFEATLDGFDGVNVDLDLRLLDASGTVIQSSAGVTSEEVISFCAQASRELALHVVNYSNDASPYRLSVVEQAASCCVDDGLEPNSTPEEALPIAIGEPVVATICPDDDDFYTFSVDGSSTLSLTLEADGDADLDVDVLSEDGRLVMRGDEVGDEAFEVELAAGAYRVRVYGFASATSDYTLSTTLTELGCGDDSDCPLGTICLGGSCEDDACMGLVMCPPGHLCASRDPSPEMGACGVVCTSDLECREGEACKRFVDGAACGVRGSARGGEACTSHEDCAGQRTCVDWPGGYCAMAGCATSADCEPGTHCVESDGVRACAIDCSSPAVLCREAEGYSCDIAFDEAFQMQWVCLPGAE